MKSVKGTQTEKNILTAFSGESQARNRYTFFGSKAEKDGFIFVRDIFLETAWNEEAHAKTLFKHLEGGQVEISGAFPAGVIADTHSNLIEAAAGEHEEYSDMYPKFAEIAQQEGFPEVAARMRNIAIAEKFHETRYLELARMIKDDTMFNNDTPCEWRCLRCSCIVTGKSAPKVCPACGHPQSYFVRKDMLF